MKDFYMKHFLERIEKRETLLKKGKLKKKTVKILQDEMQKDHQQVLTVEAQSEGEIKQELNLLRKEIEKQQQMLIQPKQLAYKKNLQSFIPTQPVVKNTIRAFLVGGLICTLGQLLIMFFSRGALSLKEAGTAASVTLIFMGALLTGIGIYDEIGRFGGAGAFIPITGFANTMVSSAMEFKREGYVYGVGARLFYVAGPVILYGTVVSIIIGLIYYLIR